MRRSQPCKRAEEGALQGKRAEVQRPRDRINPGLFKVHKAGQGWGRGWEGRVASRRVEDEIRRVCQESDYYRALQTTIRNSDYILTQLESTGGLKTGE